MFERADGPPKGMTFYVSWHMLFLLDVLKGRLMRKVVVVGFRKSLECTG